MGKAMIESSSSLFEYQKLPQGDPLQIEVFKLRYKVYAEEWGFERKEDHPGEIEMDEYDDHSLAERGKPSARGAHRKS